MLPRFRRVVGLLLLSALVVLFARGGRELSAQPKPSPVVAPPQAPALNAVGPFGITRGTALELVLTGTNLQDPRGVWTSFPAKVTIPTDMDNGKDGGKLRVKLEVVPETPIGFGQVRVATARGISNGRTFCVDELPAVAQVEANKTREAAQAVPVPCVVTGRVENESSNFYKVTLAANQRLSVEVVGRRLGGQLDPVIFLHDAKTGREIGGLTSDDAPGLQTDARLTHTFKAAGEYLIEVRDTLHRGGGEFYYRLRIGDFPLALTPWPVAVTRGAKASVGFTGPAVEGVAPVEVTAPADPAVTSMGVTPRRGGGQGGWPVALQISDMPELLEAEPNNTPEQAQQLTLPCGVSGRFLEKNDLDHFKFAVQKDQKYVIAAETLEIGSPCEVYLTLKNAKGAEVGRSNPQAPTARIDYTAAEDGVVTLKAEHLNYVHGPNEVYHLVVRKAEPDVEVVLGLDRFEAAPGGGGVIPVTALTRRDYNGPIELTLAGPAGISGSITVPEGAGLPASGVLLVPFTIAPNVPVGAHELKLLARGTAGGKPFTRVASVTEVVKANMNGLVFPPRPFTTSLAVTVTDKPLFRVQPAALTLEGIRGIPLNLNLKAQREAAAGEEIAVSVVGLPPTITAAPRNIAKGKDDGGVTLTLAANTLPGTYSLSVRSASKVGGKDVAYYSPAISLAIVQPVEIKVDASPISLKPGEKKKLKVQIARKAGYDNAVEVEVKNLPANVTAGKVVIPKDKTEAEVEIAAQPNAAAGEKADVSVVATATGTANQQASSPNLTVRIEKVEPKKEPEKKDAPKKEPEKKDAPKKEPEKKAEPKKDAPKKEAEKKS